MAVEVARVRARKKIRLPTGDDVYIAVITEISFLDQNGQEVRHFIENTSNGNRETHIDQVHSSHAGVSGHIDVERIDTLKVNGTDPEGHFWETDFEPDNKTGSDTTPPSFTTHIKTHVFRYYQDPNSPNDSMPWVDSELIDEISLLDQRGMEEHYYLLNAGRGDPAGQADPNDPDLTAPASGLDPPFRTDQYQNIVDFFGHAHTGGPVHLTVGVAVHGQIAFSGQFGIFSVLGGSLQSDGAQALDSWEKIAGVWTFVQLVAVHGTLSGTPASQGSGNVPVGGHTAPFTPIWSMSGNGIASFQLNDSAGLWIGPYGPIDFSSCSFTSPGRTYVFDSIIGGTALTPTPGEQTVDFVAILSFDA